MGFADFVGGLFGSHTDEVKPVVTAQQIALDPRLQEEQQSYAADLSRQAAGQGPSVAGTMLTQANDQNAANMNAQAAGMRGVNAGLAMRQAMQTNARSAQDTAAQASVARQQEQRTAQGLLGTQLNTMQGQNMQMQGANQGAQTAANQLNAGIAVDNTKTNNNVAGGMMSGAASGLGLAALAHGGVVPGGRFAQRLADGGFVSIPFQSSGSNPYAKSFTPGGPSKSSSSMDVDIPGSNLAGPDSPISGGALSPGDMMFASQGARVPGHANVSGDSLKNDVVPTMLSPGEVVIPRSVSTHPGFLAALEKHVRSMPGKGPQGFAQVLAARKGQA